MSNADPLTPHVAALAREVCEWRQARGLCSGRCESMSDRQLGRAYDHGCDVAREGAIGARPPRRCSHADD